MQSATGKRVLSTLASKIHPQLPLSPRESQQLLSLLTQSFRAHLDREHPFPPSESTQRAPSRQLLISSGQRAPSPHHAAASSYASTTQHLDLILNNPLFAVKPRRRGSGSAAVDVLRDPVGWFINEIASGSATLQKAAICLEVLEKTTNESLSRLKDGATPANVLSEWLRTSGLDTSRQFLDMCISKSGNGSRFLDRLVALQLTEGETSAPWRWFIRSNEQRVKETGLDVSRVTKFRQQLLEKMVSIEANTSLNSGLATFMQAFRFTENAGYESAHGVLRTAGGRLVNRIISSRDQSIDLELYQSFSSSLQRWLGSWSRAVEAMLSLHRPSESSPMPGLKFIEDPAGAATFAQSSRSRRNFLVQLCLGVARQLLEQEKFSQAHVAMEFTKMHFADLVLPKPATLAQPASEPWSVRREQQNLELLDRLIPT
ncbi:hypothetical protein COCC4DRAFT_195979 [Bipolaris maydis ATCC 48331]|uniref:Uncharacterized protein n=2 Tax=Cochliobolus heterostrophus TaxID=5016 RepID=M2SV80_COCH5|nr:uncharacterized protein COCC4DRAFT_195979 [Bipolaris maydis ATCC 48331]EMD89270.1 hypothetical protein COCHEDRAFT_1032327 [Bipolaris maydis C5]KAJ5057139.1 hypothetical protein J3E74DRAFT_12448 [Bipolaris maydis]ENI05013.1 hypothetical protein COCC4DRAFT_195979 [Bipolaris maydis ATCC 48331]KAJ6194331.1 hypothetical protein J3E72DRAFT_12308 [Bipolaris maydis]KAJ6212629.1 hypothetical protein PSV09DRAFT_1032327 [Bipolaris maydis]